MRRKNTGRRLNENAWWLLKEEDEDLDMDLGEEGGEEEDLDLDDDAEEVADVDVDAITSAVEDLAGALGLEIADEGGDEELELEDEEDEGGEEAEEEFAFEESHNMLEADEELDESDADEVMEISESMLRKEIARMTKRRRVPSKRARRSNSRLAEARRRRIARRRRLAEMGDPVAAMHSGADDVIEVTEEDLINALAEELGDSAGAELSVDGSGVAADGEAGQFGGGRSAGPALAERRRIRHYRKQLAEAKKQAATLKKQAVAAKKELKESNLFNAKLLYVNKLMQSYDLNVKQQRAIVEALDNAKTLREAKLLYTTLTDSLKKGRSTKGGTMNEGVSKTGSASKSVRSSAPAKSGTELGRWAVLAGLNK